MIDKDMTPEQIARDTYKEDLSTRWWVHYPGAAYSYNVDFRDPVNVDEMIDECLNWLRSNALPEGTEIYK